MKATTMSTAAKAINARRNSTESILSDFLGAWGVVNRDTIKTEYKAIETAIKETKARDKAAPELVELNDKRVRYEYILAKIKSTKLGEDEREAIVSMIADGLTTDKLTIEYIKQGLTGTKLLSADDKILERRKRKGEEEQFVELSHWTVCKLAKYFRLAHANNVSDKK